MPKFWLLWLLLLTWLAPSAAAQNLVLNGGFETGTFSSWTQTGNTGFSGVTNNAGDPSAPSPQGTYHAYFGPLSTGGIFQNFATTIGMIYRVSYFLNSGASRTNTRTFQAQVGNPGALTTLESLTNPALFTGYVQRTFTFTATTAISQIHFTFENDPDYWRLDNVFVTRAVPEIDPSSSRLPLLLLLGGLLLVSERRRSTSRPLSVN